MKSRIEEPTSFRKPMTPGDDNVRSTHPAFGQISIFKVHGRTNLYGSDFTHHNHIKIAVSVSEHNRNLSHDWYFERERLLELEMSEAQWANFVSSFNTQAVPCTLRYVHGDKEMRPGLPDPDLRREFSKEVEKTFQDSLDQLRQLREKIESETVKLPKKTKEGLLDHIRMAMQEISMNVPFVKDGFDKHVEDSIEKAKVEVHAYMNGEVTRAGLQVLQEQSKLLGYDEKEQNAD